MIARRDAEQEQLKQKIEDLRIRTKHDIALLKAERDAAMAIVERRQTAYSSGSSFQIFLRKNINWVIIASSVMLVIIMLLSVAVIKLLSS